MHPVKQETSDFRPDLVRWQAGRELGEVLAASVNFFNPGVIVIGGDIAHADEHLLAGVREVVYQRAVPLGTRSLRIVRSALDDRAGVIGAAVMVIEHVLAPEAVDRLIAGSAAGSRRVRCAVMPELPEAERARREIDRVVGREIVAVDDRDTYVCRPHAPGEIERALLGHALETTHRRGKFLWVETSDAGPVLGLHLGMAGRIDVDQPPAAGNWDRFALEFAGGGRLALRDKRRLGRALLEPDFSHVGPDAAEIGREAFRTRVGRGTAPLKARLLDQHVLAGIGNLLADEILWHARLSPQHPAGALTAEELDRLRRAVRTATRSAIRRGGAHTGELIRHRTRDGHCPRCGTPLARATVGGRTTYWCPACQPALSPRGAS